MPDVPGVAYKVFSLLAKEKINVDMILQSYGHDERKDIVFTVADKDSPACARSARENKDVLKYDHMDINTGVSRSPSSAPVCSKTRASPPKCLKPSIRPISTST